MTPLIWPTEASTLDTDRLIQLVAALEKSQLTADPDAFLLLFDPEAVWVTGGGRRLVGLDEIEAFTRSVLPGWTNGGSVTYTVRHVRFLSDDVAVTSVDQEYFDVDGRPFSPRQRGLPTYTWRKRGNDWKIINGQNTPVPVDDGALTLSPADEEALRAIVRRVAQGVNEQSADLLLHDIADDAVIVQATGVVARGREAIAASVRVGLAGPIKGATAYYRISDLELIAPDVAVLHKDAWASESDAESGEPPVMNAHYVFVRRDGRWWILRRHNALVVRT